MNNYQNIKKFSYFLLSLNWIYLLYSFFLGSDIAFYRDKIEILMDYKNWLFIGVLTLSTLFSFLLNKFFSSFFGKKAPRAKRKWFIREFLKYFSFHFVAIIGLFFSLGLGFEKKHFIFYVVASFFMWRSFPKDYPTKIRV